MFPGGVLPDQVNSIMEEALRLYLCGAMALAQQMFVKSTQSSVRQIEKTSSSPRVCVVTGASSGIGFETAVGLAAAGFHVVVAFRDHTIANGIISALNARVSDGIFVFHPLDLRSVSSIVAFACWFRSQHSSLHVLVNNAGVMLAPFEKTELGIELHRMVNFVGPAILTLLLLPLLAASGTHALPSRIINLSSVVHECVSSMDSVWDCDPATYSSHGSYARSKLYILMFSFQLSALLTEANIPVAVAAVHPGVVDTPLYRHVHSCLRPIQAVLAKCLFRTPLAAASIVVNVATINPAASMHGKYYTGNVVQ
jgi:dehydrogenase/reductase SDR family protein X